MTSLPDRRARRAASPQRGFSLIVVFLLVAAMVGIAGIVMMSARTDLQVAGQDRENQSAFYAAETGIAFGKDFLASQNPQPIAGPWTALLGSGNVALCRRCDQNNPPCAAIGSQPGATPQTAWVNYDPARLSNFRFCVHNNALDPNYMSAVPTGDTVDGDGIITIEGYGRVDGGRGGSTRLTVDVSAVVGNTATGAYAVRGGNATGTGTSQGQVVQNVGGF